MPTPMQIRRAGRWFGFTMLLASLVHVATVWFVPQGVMGRVFERTGEKFGFNQLVHSPPVTADSRNVVRPSPDLAYSLCAFDLLDAPVHVKVPKSADYVSVSAYDDTTNNFLVVNDSAFGPEGWEGWIAREDQAPSINGDVTVSPSRKGVILIRRLVRGPDDWAVIEQERSRMHCAPSGG